MSDTNQVDWESVAKTRELDLKEREVVAREREVAVKEKEVNKSRWGNPIFIALVVASVGLFGNLVITLLNNKNAREVEHQRSQSDLALEAMRTGSPEKACTNLMAFIHLKLLDDAKNTIQNQCEASPATAPFLPASGSDMGSIGLPGLNSVSSGLFYSTPPLSSLGLAANSNFQGLVIDASTNAPIKGAKVSIDGLGGTETGSFGQFGFSVPPASFGKFVTIKTEKDGYEPVQSLMLFLSSTAPITISLKKK
jgi:hypothetical protein